MPQKAKQSSNYDFRVEAVPSWHQLPDGTFVKDGFQDTRRTDTLEVLGKVTDRYGVVQNPDLINVAEDAFAAKGMTDYKRRIIVTGDGQRMYASYDFRNHVKKLRRGDEVGLRLTVQNSFDGSLRVSFILGLLRLLCTNGMTTLEREVGLTKKHSIQISTAFVAEALEKAIKAWDNSTAVFDRLAEVNLTQQEGLNLLGNLESQSVLSGKLREGVQSIWESPTYAEDSSRNLFNLYNAVTQHLTHGVESDRFELANRISGNMLRLLDRVARDAASFAKLTAPLPVEEVKAEIAV